MLLSILIYAFTFGWILAVGFAALLLLHELGHLLIARRYRIRASVPVFLPYVGAMIEADTKNIPRWHLALLGLGGPLLGSVGALLCWALYGITGKLYFAELAFMGVTLNLFNLLPIGFLDGGLISVAFTKWLRVPGYLILILLTWKLRNPFLITCCILTLPSTLAVIFEKPRRTTVNTRISTDRRIVLGIIYVALIAVLGLGCRSLLTQALIPAYEEGKGHLVHFNKPHPLAP